MNIKGNSVGTSIGIFNFDIMAANSYAGKGNRRCSSCTISAIINIILIVGCPTKGGNNSGSGPSVTRGICSNGCTGKVTVGIGDLEAGRCGAPRSGTGKGCGKVPCSKSCKGVRGSLGYAV